MTGSTPPGPATLEWPAVENRPYDVPIGGAEMKNIAIALALGMSLAALPAAAQTPPTTKDTLRADRDKVKASEAELQRDREQAKRDQQALEAARKSGDPAKI